MVALYVALTAVVVAGAAAILRQLLRRRTLRTATGRLALAFTGLAALLQAGLAVIDRWPARAEEGAGFDLDSLLAGLALLPAAEKPHEAWSLEIDLDGHDPAVPVKVGERVRYRIRTNAPGSLVLVNLGSDGSSNLLYPNERHPGSRVGPGELLVPGEGDGFAIEIAPPVGAEHAVAFLLEWEVADPEAVRALFAEGGSFRGLAFAVSRPKSLAVREGLLEPRPKVARVVPEEGGRRWTKAVLSYATTE